MLISSSFNQNTDCSIYQSALNPTWTTNSCLISITQTSTYVKITFQTNAAYAASYPNFFYYQSYSYVGLKNMAFTVSSSNKNVFPVYMAFYQGNVVNPITYYYARMINSMPHYNNNLAGTSLSYHGNVFSGGGNNNYQTFPNILRY